MTACESLGLNDRNVQQQMLEYLSSEPVVEAYLEFAGPPPPAAPTQQESEGGSSNTPSPEYAAQNAHTCISGPPYMRLPSGQHVCSCCCAVDSINAADRQHHVALSP